MLPGYYMGDLYGGFRTEDVTLPDVYEQSQMAATKPTGAANPVTAGQKNNVLTGVIAFIILLAILNF